jgi:hypothetical protein
MKKQAVWKLMFVFATLCLTVGISAQRLCEALVEQALNAAAENCGTLDGTLGCYAYDRLEATFQDASVGNAFEDPGGKIDIPLIHTAQTAALDLEEDEWGIGYFRARANLETVTPEEAVRIIMLGDVFLESAFDNTAPEPMQKLFFETGGPSDCQDAPNMLVIQGPDNKPIDLAVNEVPIRIGSTIALGLGNFSTGQAMFVTVLSGEVRLYPDSPQEVVLLAGQTSFARISPKTPRPGVTPENSDALLQATPESTPEGENGEGDSGDSSETDTTAIGIPPSAGTYILNKVTGEPLLYPDGTPIVRRVPLVTFSEPRFLEENAPGFLGTAYYGTVYQLPEVLLNYPLSADEVASCTLQPDTANRTLPGHVGAGYNRTVLAQIETADITFDPTNIEYLENDELWFEVTTATGTVVWVDSKYFTNVADCEAFIASQQAPRDTCFLEARVAQVSGHQEPGFNNVVLTLLEADEVYIPTARAYVNGKAWFEIEAASGDMVWADGRFFEDLTACETDAIPVQGDYTEVPTFIRTPVPTPPPAAAGGQQPPANSGQPATTGEQPPANSGQPATSDQPATTGSTTVEATPASAEALLPPVENCDPTDPWGGCYVEPPYDYEPPACDARFMGPTRANDACPSGREALFNNCTSTSWVCR